MKYIIFESDLRGIFPIVFHNGLPHDFIHTSVKSQFPGVKAMSAGFCDKEGITWGESVGLKLKSLPEDTVFLKKMLNN